MSDTAGVFVSKSVVYASVIDPPQSPADINGDGVVDILDFSTIAMAINSSLGDPKWNPRADVNYDDAVNILDLVTFLLMTKESDTSFDRSSIFFEYGAESGKLQPPWSECGVSPGATYSSHSDPSGVWVNDTHVRSGTKSTYLYQHNPPKGDSCRRITNGYYGEGITDEYYFSWWAYFPSSNWDNEDPVGWGTTLGGIQLYWGASNQPSGLYQWSMGLQLYVDPTGNRQLYLRYGWDYTTKGKYCGTYVDKYWYSNFYLRKGLMDQWIHFQIYIKYRDDGTGVVRGWINNVLIGEMTGLTNDPRAYPEWNQMNCEFAVIQYPWIVTSLYQSQDSPEHWCWVDDCVGAYKKVPEDYGVGYP